MKWRQYLPITIILVIASVLRIYNLGQESFWIDEFNSVHDAKNLVLSSRFLYFAILRLWLILTSNDVWLRGLSVLLGILCTFLIYRLGERLIGQFEGQIAALIVALSPIFINHSQEVRMYMLSTSLSLLGSLFLFQSIQKPTYSFVLGWSLMRLLAIYTIPLNIVLLLPDFVLIVMQFYRQRTILFRFFLGFILIGLLWTPSVFHLSAATQKYSSGWVSTKSPITFVKILQQLTVQTAFPLTQFALPDLLLRFYQLHSCVLMGLLSIALIYRWRSPGIWSLAIWGILSAASMAFVSKFILNLWTDRYLLFFSPYLILLIAAGFVYLYRRSRVSAITIAVIYLAVNLSGLTTYYRNQDRLDWRNVVQLMQQNSQPEELVIVSPGRLSRVFDHYYDGSVGLYPVDQLQLEQNITPETVETIYQDLPESTQQIWLVYRRPATIRRKAQGEASETFHQQLRATFAAEFDIQQNYSFFEELDLFQMSLKSPVN